MSYLPLAESGYDQKPNIRTLYADATTVSVGLIQRETTENYTDAGGLFANHPYAKIWLGPVALFGETLRSDDYLGQRQFRATVYINECGFLTELDREADGGESDDQDERSVQYAAIENDGPHGTVIGSMRMIHKRDSRPLPVESLFPEAFDTPAIADSTEASRFISRHSNKRIQSAVSIGLIRAVIARALPTDQEIYAVVESPLAKRFAQLGLPYTQLADEKPLSEYGNTINMPLRFSPVDIMSAVASDSDRKKLITPYLEKIPQEDGTGYFDLSLLKKKEV